MKKLLSFLFALLFTSCSWIEGIFNEDFIVTKPKIIKEVEAITIKESLSPPDFTTHIIENVKLEDLSEYQELKDLNWLTSMANSPGSPHAKKGGKLYTYLHDIPNTFRYTGPGADEISKMLFQNHIPLLFFSFEDGKPLPGIATHWAFGKDGKTVYYRLNENAKWSDGMPCTADDFIFAINFMQNPKIRSFLDVDDFIDLKIKKINDRYIAISSNSTLFASNELLLKDTNITPRAKHFYKNIDFSNWVKDYNRIAEPTTGAYFLNEWDFNYGLSFKKVDNWWAYEYKYFSNMFNFDFIEIRILPGTQASIRKYFRNEQLDLIPITTQDEYLNAINDARTQRGFADIWRAKYNGVEGLNGILFNTEKVPLNNIEFRRAMEYVIDINGLIDAVLQRDYKRCNTMGENQVCDGFSFNNKNIKMGSFNKEKARNLLEKAGYEFTDKNGIRVDKEGNKASFTILYTDKELKDIFGYLFAKALECGVELDFQFVSGGILEKIKRRNFQAWWASIPSSNVPNHYHLLHSLTRDSPPYLSNIFGFKDSKLDSILEEYNKNNISIKEKAILNQKLEAMVKDNALFLPTYVPSVKKCLCWKYIRFPGWISMPLIKDFFSDFACLAWFDPLIKNEIDKAFNEGAGFERRVWKGVKREEN